MIKNKLLNIFLIVIILFNVLFPIVSLSGNDINYTNQIIQDNIVEDDIDNTINDENSNSSQDLDNIKNETTENYPSNNVLKKSVTLSRNNSQIIEDGEYKIRFTRDKNKTIHEANNANIEIRADYNTLQNRFQITYLGDGYYKIKSLKTGKCLDVVNAGIVNGTNVRTWADNGSDAQKWIIKDVGNGNYNIISKCNGLYLDVWCAFTDDGTNIQMYENNDGIAQKFTFEKVVHQTGTKTIEDGEYKLRFSRNKTIYEANNANIEIRSDYNTLQNRFQITYLGDGYYKIKSLKTGKCLDVENAGMVNGTNVRTWADNGSDAQKWIIKDVGNGNYNIISKCNGLYLDVWCAFTDDGTNIQMYENNDGIAQKFTFEKVVHQTGTKTIEDGEYKIKYTRDKNKTIHEANNANIEIRADYNTLQNRFQITYLGDGYYKIKSLKTGKCLDVVNAAMANGTNVRTWADNGSDAQKWIIKDAGNGNYNIISKCNGLYLDVWCAFTDDGTNIQMYEKNEGIAQKFIFEKVVHQTGTKTIEDGEYKIKYTRDKNKTIHEANNANIEIRADYNTLQNRFQITYLGDGYYKIKSLKTGKCLDVVNAAMVNGTNVRTWADNGSDAQKWIIKDVGNGNYNIISKCNGLYLDVWCAFTDDGTNIQMYENNEGIAQKFTFEKVIHEKGVKTIDNGVYKIIYANDRSKVISISNQNAIISKDENLRYQTFQITYLGDGYYKIKSFKFDKCLDVQDAGMENGTNARIWADNGADAQKWIIKDAGNGTYNIISKCNDLCLDVVEASTREGANVQLFDSNGTIAQKFIFEKTTPHVIDDGIYEIASSVNPNYVVDVNAAAKYDYANIQIWNRLDVRNQKFRITHVENGYYMIQALHSGKVLDVAGAGTQNGTNVQQFQYNNSDAQKWLIKEVGDGTYNLISKCNNLCLDVSGGIAQNGINVSVYSQNGTKAQAFYLRETTPKYLEGIDVSFSQGKIDWNTVKNSGIDFAIIRCGYGQDIISQDDMYFSRNVAECERLGIPYGVYIYSYALNEANASSEADHTLRLLRQANANPTLGVWFDMEDADGYKLKYGMPSNETLVNICKTYCDKINQNGYKAGIYASLYWLENQLNDSKLDQYDVWVAHWADKCGYNKPYVMWQYTSSGSVNGILKEVDRDILYK